jgi:hypothetical protein
LEIFYSLGRQVPRTQTSGAVGFCIGDGTNEGKILVTVFLPFMGFPLLPRCFGAQSVNAQMPADQPVPWTDRNSLIAHAPLLEKARERGIGISIRWVIPSRDDGMPPITRNCRPIGIRTSLLGMRLIPLEYPTASALRDTAILP